MKEINNECESIISRLSGDEEKLKLVCETCGEPIYQSFEVEFGGKMRHVITPRQCECARLRAAQFREQARRNDVEIARDRTFANNAAKLCRFETSQDSQNLRAVRRYADKWEEIVNAGAAGLLLWGGVGTGKTHSAYCLANALIDKGVSVFITTIPALADSVFDDKFGKALTMNRVKGCGLLILDDVGTERDTSFMNEKAFEFIDERIKTGKPIVVTTNISPQDMDAATDINKKRVFDRVRGATVAIEFSGVSKRAEKTAQNAARLREILNGGQEE